MKPENRALLVIVVAVVAFAAVGGGYFLVTPSTPSTLIVPWGTVFQVPSAEGEFEFNVTPPGGTLLGAWSSSGPTCVMVFPLGISIPRMIFVNCIAQGALSGTFNANLTSFPSWLYVLAFLSDNPVTVWVTQTIEFVHS